MATVNKKKVNKSSARKRMLWILCYLIVVNILMTGLTYSKYTSQVSGSDSASVAGFAYNFVAGESGALAYDATDGCYYYPFTTFNYTGTIGSDDEKVSQVALNGIIEVSLHYATTPVGTAPKYTVELYSTSEAGVIQGDAIDTIDFDPPGSTASYQELAIVRRMFGDFTAQACYYTIKISPSDYEDADDADSVTFGIRVTFEQAID